ncbi:Transcriptional enhancer factor TEF-1 [Anabarilius grahami]|uniref:Transcriptional enhancer factor TEF-1 n=1 Tax=Anabarilius grahami TaxID=495550 RepID=A0A3N0YZ94_ANAGA|nr:Transcriptional enhancer factor TEF-1 [Anabarilius grahami]
MDPSSWSGSESAGEDIERMSDSADKPMDNDAEGVWSPDIEQSFQEALAIYPPCGRRKIILSDEGKMYGTNSVIMVMTTLGVFGMVMGITIAAFPMQEIYPGTRDIGVTLPLKMICGRRGVIVLRALPVTEDSWLTLIRCIKPFSQQNYPIQTATAIAAYESPTPLTAAMPVWHGRSIGTSKLRLVEFSSFLEHQRDPDSYNKHLFVHIGQTNYSYNDALLETVDIRQIYDKFPEKKGGLKELFGKGPQNSFFLVKFWADLNCNIQEDSGAFYGVTSQYESSENMTITCSTKVCSFGKQVVEKVETEYARFENGRFVYKISRSPMCEYMINFIHKLKHLPEKYMMNSVLENFTILLVGSTIPMSLRYLKCTRVNSQCQMRSRVVDC